ncbi:MAG: phosphoribosylformylglycinamidine cyclo-ligase [Bacillota bacterium]|nr:phosphoribosylformylglycinamidine cyclo-ligase [Bacillota bacterium]HOB91515.1 phosphoribosylformylglycinamidine cyclo-ligase [Bacillota bacterium]HPZ54669.1 phosphoribosylformylglycinamidine cyclo-ligase [Bacillota bacterium]HQD19102.1 phosphoribosylformylglycinamidine cyclo-ligase [Bacillota bacterium]
MSDKLTYKSAGVDIDLANQTKSELKTILASDDPRVLNAIGAFGSLYDFSFPEYESPVLVLKTEEPGSKQILAFQYDRYESICYDMINHLINDCIVMGARPLAVQDAIICGKLEKDKVQRMISAMAQACKQQGCTLTGGEISEQPGVIPAGTYILTSSIVGIVDRKDIIDGSTIAPGDVVIGVESSGLHTNGYSLVRKLLEKDPGLAETEIEGRSFIDLVLEPHRCYYNTVRGLFGTGVIKGMAHITGGGILENLNRILKTGVDAVIDLSAYEVQPVFSAIKAAGDIADSEMLRTFNLGVGLAIVCDRENVDHVISHIKDSKVDAYVIGEIVQGSGQVIAQGDLRWPSV